MPGERIIAKAIKIESFQENGLMAKYRLHVKKGDILDGYFYKWPVVGDSFVIYTCTPDHIYNSPAPVNPVYTTIVKEIIDDRTFRTKNSIYKIVTLEDERNEKISIIIE